MSKIYYEIRNVIRKSKNNTMARRFRKIESCKQKKFTFATKNKLLSGKFVLLELKWLCRFITRYKIRSRHYFLDILLKFFLIAESMIQIKHSFIYLNFNRIKFSLNLSFYGYFEKRYYHILLIVTIIHGS